MQSPDVRMVTEAAQAVKINAATAPLKAVDVAHDQRLDDLEVLGGLNPGNVNDATTASLIRNQESDTHSELSAAIDDSAIARTPMSLVDVNEMVVQRAASPLVTPTYDGTGQTVHPDVIFIPGGWGGYAYWMGITPYPDGVDTTENPSILASHDGTIWEVPAGLTNPIAMPVSGFWPDPDLTFDPIKRRLYLVWLGHYVAWSDNGTDWTAPLMLVSGVQGTGEVSPAVVRETSTEYRMWSVQRVDGGATNKIWHRSGASMENPISGWQNTKVECTFTPPPGKEPWHIDVQKTGSTYLAAIACCDAETSGANTVLYLATSSNGFDWEFGTKPALAGHPGGWDETNIYRATLLPSNGSGGVVADLWYSARSKGGQWRTGRTAVRWIDPAVTKRSPLATFAEHRDSVRATASTRNLATVNPSLLEPDGLVPIGWGNFLISATQQGWDSIREAYKLRWNGGNISSLATISVTAGQEYCFSVEHATDEAGATRPAILWKDSGGATLSSLAGPNEAGKPEFQRVAVSGIAPMGAVSATLVISGPSSNTGKLLYWRRVQFERGLIPTEWTPGVGSQIVLDGVHDAEQVLTPATSEGQLKRWRIGKYGQPVVPTFIDSERPTASQAGAGAIIRNGTTGELMYSNGASWDTHVLPVVPVVKTSGDPLVATDRSVLANMTLGATLRLPAVADSKVGQTHEVKNIGPDPLPVKVRYDIGLIDGGTTKTLAPWEYARYVFANGQWLTF